jgi:hypothetical protein
MSAKLSRVQHTFCLRISMLRLQRQERNFTLLRRHVVGVSRSASRPRYPTARSVENGERCSLVSSQAQLADGTEVARHIKYIGQLSYENKRSHHTTAAPSSNCVDLEAPVVVRPGRSRQPKLHSADILNGTRSRAHVTLRTPEISMRPTPTPTSSAIALQPAFHRNHSHTR